MREIIARLLVALAVAAGAQGVGTAGDHASPDGNSKAVAAIEAIIASVSDAVEQAQAVVEEQAVAAGQPETTGLDRALEMADEHAADGLARAAEAPPVDTPPVAVPAASGPPDAAPPVPAPPVPTPPVDPPDGRP